MALLRYSPTVCPVRSASWVMSANGMPIRMTNSASKDRMVDFDMRMFQIFSIPCEFINNE